MLASKTRAAKTARSDRRGLVIAGGSQAKLRKPSKREWTKAKEQEFLTVLAETCNVTQACRESGMSLSAAYGRRKKVGAFRKAWGESIAIAYQRLELELLRRAFDGTEKISRRKDGSEERVREYPNAIALQLLKMHKDTAEAVDREPDEGEMDALQTKLQGKIERLRKRLIADGDTAE